MKQPINKKLYRTYYGNTIKTIYHKFVRPFLSRLSSGEDETTLSDGIKRFFSADTRSVYFAKARDSFTIPGKEWLHGHPMVLGYSGSPRLVESGMGFVVRFDTFDLNLVEIEFEERVYSMDAGQWASIKERVEFIA